MNDHSTHDERQYDRQREMFRGTFNDGSDSLPDLVDCPECGTTVAAYDLAHDGCEECGYSEE